MRLFDRFKAKPAVSEEPLMSEARISKAHADLLDLLPSPYNKKLNVMYHSTRHVGSDGLEHDACIATKISVPEGMAIFNLCRENKAMRTLEIGLAYGFSTMYFLAASENSFHVAIDPFIEEWWHGVGLNNVKEVGMSNRVRFIGDISLIALPKLLAESAKFDVLFIDGNPSL
jgi:predicted O-methyltransferase YrrM